MKLETSLESCSERQASKYGVEFGMGKEHTISKWSKLDIDEFKLKQEFLQGCQDLNPSLVIKHTKQTPGYKRRVANKHKEHEHRKLVVY